MLYARLSAKGKNFSASLAEAKLVLPINPIQPKAQGLKTILTDYRHGKVIIKPSGGVASGRGITQRTKRWSFGSRHSMNFLNYSDQGRKAVVSTALILSGIMNRATSVGRHMRSKWQIGYQGGIG